VGPISEGLYFLLTSAKCLNQFLWILAHFYNVLFQTHLLIQNSPNLSNTVATPGEIINSDFAFTKCYRKYSLRCLDSLDKLPIKILQQHTKRRKDRSRPWSAKHWTAAKLTMLANDLICREACRRNVLSVRYQWSNDVVLNAFASKQQIWVVFR